MATTLSNPHELYSEVMFIKKMLNKEIVKYRLGSTSTLLSQQEIYTRLDLIHEAERKGFRHLDARSMRKLEKLVEEIDALLEVEETEEEQESAANV